MFLDVYLILITLKLVQRPIKIFRGTFWVDIKMCDRYYSLISISVSVVNVIIVFTDLDFISTHSDGTFYIFKIPIKFLDLYLPSWCKCLIF